MEKTALFFIGIFLEGQSQHGNGLVVEIEPCLSDGTLNQIDFLVLIHLMGGFQRLMDAMADRIREVRSEGDSVGGVIECRIRGVPAGRGEPVFDRLEADLAKAMLSLPATKGFEIGTSVDSCFG